MLVHELMRGGVVSITPEESAALAARLLSRHDLGALPVCGQDGALLGIVTDRDIITRCVAAGEDASRVPVRDIMSSSPVTSGGADPGAIPRCWPVLAGGGREACSEEGLFRCVW